MVAYVLVDIDVTDPQGFEDYKRLAQAAVTKYGGTYLVRGGETATLEGGWSPNRLVILEFENLARAKDWYNSPEYTEARRVRKTTARFRMVAADGL
ncbi:MAG: DUF1330 domain-containing protein [Gammaproteobacteria bacterium]|nr:DUF1330 domain-containing protein [Gammaproteobacteria bacterium]